MITKQDIEKGLNSHVLWKQRLLDAVIIGKSEFKVEQVQVDNGCEFGKWLYGLSKQDQNSTDFQSVKDLHADFHKSAAKILNLALSGKRMEAQNHLDYKSEYSRLTGKLVLALNNWKNSIKQ